MYSLKIMSTKNWYEHKPHKVVETDSVTILWDFSIHKNRRIQAKKPYITKKNHKEKNMQTN